MISTLGPVLAGQFGDEANLGGSLPQPLHLLHLCTEVGEDGAPFPLAVIPFHYVEGDGRGPLGEPFGQPGSRTPAPGPKLVQWRLKSEKPPRLKW